MRALVIHKQTSYERLVLQEKNPRVLDLLQHGDPTVTRMRHAHEDHLATVDEVKGQLERLGIDASYYPLQSPFSTEGVDLVITLGGDGTLLWASHQVGAGVPMLGINTAPMHSVGYFCAADRASASEQLERAVQGKIRSAELTRMQVEVDGELVTTRVLNDVLFSATCPAATSRYLLYRGETYEDQRSSGVWISTAAGSTAATRSAGGKVLPIRSEQLEYVVREPYTGTGRPLQWVKGFVEQGEELRIRNRMGQSCLYLDGPHRSHEIGVGADVRFRASNEPLTLFASLRRRKASPSIPPR